VVVASRPTKVPVVENGATLETVYLDTETTGLDDHHSVVDAVEIAIVDDNGNVLINSLLRPSCPISSGAFMVHKITEAMVAEAPTLQDLEQRIIEAVRGKLVVMYNKTFPLRQLPEPRPSAA
jgi:DNA polymerase III epsilon subunit-like protein